MLLHWIYVVVIGFIAGLIAKFILPGPNNPSGFILTTILGIVGSVVANFIAVKVGWITASSEGGFLLSGIVGAVILLAIYHLVMRNTQSTTV